MFFIFPIIGNKKLPIKRNLDVLQILFLKLIVEKFEQKNKLKLGLREMLIVVMHVKNFKVKRFIMRQSILMKLN
jgi:hypothetical protein